MNEIDEDRDCTAKRKRKSSIPLPRKKGETCPKCKKDICQSCRTKFYRRKKTIIGKVSDLSKEFPGTNILVLVEAPGQKKRRVVCFGSGRYQRVAKKNNLDDVLNYLENLEEEEEEEK